MPVKYAKWFSITTLIGGLLVGGINGWLLSLGAGAPLGLIPGIVLLIVGALSLFNPMYLYKEGILQARNLLGMTLFRHEKEKLSIEDGKSDGELILYMTRKTGSRKRMMSTKSFFMDRAQVTALVDSLRAEQTF